MDVDGLLESVAGLRDASGAEVRVLHTFAAKASSPLTPPFGRRGVSVDAAAETGR